MATMDPYIPNWKRKKLGKKLGKKLERIEMNWKKKIGGQKRGGGEFRGKNWHEKDAKKSGKIGTVVKNG